MSSLKRKKVSRRSSTALLQNPLTACVRGEGNDFAGPPTPAECLATHELGKSLRDLQQPHVPLHPRALARKKAKPDELAHVGRAAYESYADMN